eukprot:COSAG03_NODE_13558_length_498_cov_0.882206_1_plen_128_part_01
MLSVWPFCASADGAAFRGARLSDTQLSSRATDSSVRVPTVAAVFSAIQRSKAVSAEEMEEVTVAITSLRNELEQTRDNRRLQELESKAKSLRRRRYEAEKGLKAERKRLCPLAAAHYPELPLRFPGAG